ncbi:MAG: cytochrome P450, partial [Flavobacteriaceae bacterium]
NDLQEMWVRQLRQPFLSWWFHLNVDIGKNLGLSGEARAILDKIIQKRVAAGDRKDDLLDMLLNARYEDGSFMTRQQLIDEVIILFIAGHETTANALSFTLWLLARNPSIQEKVFMEVSKLDFGGGLDLSVLSQLSFTKNCIEESMRLYPPAYFVDRVSVEGDTIKDSFHKSGTIWLVNLYAMHRHPEFWDRPHDFVPERFNVQNAKSFSGHYFPFGAGPRMCVGNNFAMYEMILVISQIVQRYKLTTPLQQMELQPLITLRPQSASIAFKARTG